MISLKTAQGWLVLAAGTISMEISSPFFNADTVPGTISYPFGLPMEGNAPLLGFPHLRAEQGERIAPEPVEFYIDGQLRWVGALLYLDCDEERALYSYHFVADAADLQSRIDGVSLPSLDLGRAVLELVPDAADYALPCLRNTAFYGDEPASYCRVVNYYHGGAYDLSPGGQRSPIVPFLRLVPLLRRVMAALGYALSGPWLGDPEAQALVIYSDRALEQADGSLPADFALNRHVPDIDVGELLVAVQKFCGLAYSFHPVRRELAIRALRDVITDQQYLDRPPAGRARTTALTTSGFVLKMGLESDDELNKTLDTGWAQLRVGAGQQEISTSAGTLHVVREADPANAGRQWLVPAVQAKGASPAFGLGDDSHCGLRLLFDRGLRPDSTGLLYPLATWDRLDFAGTVCGLSTLHWEGEFGLYATWHQAWLDFLDRATTKELTMEFRVADLLSLDPARKEMLSYRKYLWEKVSLSLKTTGRQLETAAFTYRYARL